MMTTKVKPEATLEEERRELIADLAADEGPDWLEKFKAGSFGCHELLDRTSLIVDLVERCLREHPACLANPAWFALADQAASALHQLYQGIGADHMAADD